MSKDSKPPGRFTEHAGQARIFVKKSTASRWAKRTAGSVLLRLESGKYVVYHSDKGWLK